jgi:hypothetical protein
LGFAKEKLTTEEIKNEMLLRTDGKGRTVCHATAYWGKVDIMQVIWELAKEKLTSEEIKNEMLLAQTIGEGLPGTLQHMGAN